MLVVDADPAVRRALARAMLEHGLSVDTAESGAAAVDLLRARRADAVLLGALEGAPGAHGLATLARLREQHPDLQVVMLVPHADPGVAAAALQGGAHAILGAPVESVEVARALVERAIERARLGVRADRLERDHAEQAELGEIVASAPRMLEMVRRAGLAAASSAPVLVMGEAGTGKTLVARTVHRRSPRGSRDLVTVSPLALGEDPDRASRALTQALDEAEDATLLVEDLGDLPALLQAVLVKGLGGRHDRSPRVIATAGPELREKVARGEVRKELFYGLGAVLVELPPLRERRDDIPLLAYHFLPRIAAREGKAIRRIGPEALRELRDHEWPGNVGELRSAVEHAVVMTRGEVILPSDLPHRHARRDLGEDLVRVEVATADVLELAYPEAKERALATFDGVYVAHCLARAGGNVSEAARLAGMDRSNFRRLLKRSR